MAELCVLCYGHLPFLQFFFKVFSECNMYENWLHNEIHSQIIGFKIEYIQVLLISC